MAAAFASVQLSVSSKPSSRTACLVISIEYRLAPEHPLPIAYDGCWTALQWVVSPNSNGASNKEPWLSTCADFDRVYVGGVSAGANLTHNTLMRAGSDALHGGVKIKGAFLARPYFWGSNPVGSESKNMEETENRLR
ncbi:ARM repeat protein interacting with ABF2 isoform 1 [Hibiscus syriacus]|uniref:ARM repeat protein interacting with ABF2 isoform 1 n=1 Tax=Hibiscus syriacus TaxID=106335 RepID=A0A6A2YDL8_HIBSY|nr:2-hydroxyisoflavanone dehydratase-like [Hibiscus syriacus]KAE8670314.1 ARM repeat protein interacting with ABF2 isoform 1 [Hibiscus syriacus]